MRVAVIDGFGSGRWLTRALNEHGAECVHVRSRPRLVSYLEATFQPGDYVADLGHDSDLAAVARRILECGAEWIVAGNESGVRTGDELTHLTGLPGNLHQIAGARRDKHLMSKRLRAVGLAAPEGTLVSTTEDAVAWFETAGLGSVVVKPVDSAGSDHVRFCRTRTDVLNACDGILASENVFGTRNRAAVIQEALTGPEYYVNTVSVGGQHLIAETWRYTKTRTPDGAPVFDYEEPAEPGSSPVDAVHAYVRNALDALGVRYGAAHSEVILTARGPVLIDPGIRLGGGVLPWVAEKFLGYSHASLLAESIIRPSDALARSGRLPESWLAPIRYVSLINLQPGLARPNHQWTTLLSSLQTVVAVAAVAAEGTFLPRTNDLISSPGYVYLSASDPLDIEADYHRIRAWEQTCPYTTTKFVR